MRKNNADEATLYVMDVASRTTSDIDVIAGAKYATASWTPAGDGFYYTWLPTDPAIPIADRPGYAEVRFRKLGGEPSLDRIIFAKTGDPTILLRCEISKDGHFLFLYLHHGWASMEVYFRDLRREREKEDDFVPLAIGQAAHYHVQAYRDIFYVHTDDGASRWRVFAVDPALPESAGWKEIVPERPNATLERMTVLGGRLALSYLQSAASRLVVRETDGTGVRDIAIPCIGSIGGPIGLPDEDAELDPGCTVRGGSSDNHKPAGRVFFTGATGFVGVHLLAELLARSLAQIDCRVLCRDVQDGRERIARALRNHGLYSPAFADRIGVVVGDKSQP